MSRILLISSNTADEPYPVYPLGMSTLASSMTASGHEVGQFDFLAEGTSEEALSARIGEFAPDFVGISIRNVDNVDSLSSEQGWYLPVSRKIVESVKNLTGAPVILGGAGYSLLPQEILDYVGADYGVVGEGEQALGQIISLMDEGKKPPRIVSAGQSLLEGDTIPAAAWDERLLDFYGPRSVIGIQTKRGCCHQCTYCTYPGIEGPVLRFREPASVAEEVERLYASYGVDRLFFADSVFNDGGGHYLSVAEEIARLELPVSWSAFFSPGRMERKNLALLKRAGLRKHRGRHRRGLGPDPCRPREALPFR